MENPHLLLALYRNHGVGALQSPLQSLLIFLKSDSGRKSLASLEAVPCLLSLLIDLLALISQKEQLHVDAVIGLLLRVLRNLCAGEGINQDAFAEHGGIEIMATMASQESLKLDKVYFQLLGNVAGRGEKNQALIWSKFFPEIFLRYASSDSKEFLGPLAMVIYTCCKSSSIRRQELVKKQGADIMVMILKKSEACYFNVHDDVVRVSDSSAYEGHWLQLLVQAVCLNDYRLPLLFENIGLLDARSSRTQSFRNEQCVLLKIFLDIVAGHAGIVVPQQLLDFLVDLVRVSASFCKLIDVPEILDLPTRYPVVNVLGYCLLLIRTLVAQEFLAGEAETSGLPVSKALASKGLVKLLLEMLESLGQPEMIKRMQLDSKTQQTSGQDENGEEQMKPFSTKNLYKGYRRDIVAALGNMAFQNPVVQDQIRQNGGLLLILQQCVLDPLNPYLREWGMWAARNLLQDNQQNREEIAALELKGPVDTSELLQAGLKVEIDPNTKKPKLVNIPAKN